MNIKTKLGEATRNKKEGILPVRSTADSAGFDVFSAQNVIILPGCQSLISTNLYFEFEKEYVMLVFPRSGNAVKRDLVLSNAVAVIDSDYRGELMIPLRNHGQFEQEIFPGDKIAQIIMLKMPDVSFTKVDEINETDRGTGGFGSTGR